MLLLGLFVIARMIHMLQAEGGSRYRATRVVAVLTIAVSAVTIAAVAFPNIAGLSEWAANESAQGAEQQEKAEFQRQVAYLSMCYSHLGLNFPFRKDEWTRTQLEAIAAEGDKKEWAKGCRLTGDNPVYVDRPK
ncbi:MAG TPA: hypothetical protein VL484_12390 [Vicinamibacterales bacterium]|nr:hypothetical protein [Vicinamibacterales bacterium]